MRKVEWAKRNLKRNYTSHVTLCIVENCRSNVTCNTLLLRTPSKYGLLMT